MTTEILVKLYIIWLPISLIVGVLCVCSWIDDKETRIKHIFLGLFGIVGIMLFLIIRIFTYIFDEGVDIVFDKLCNIIDKFSQTKFGNLCMNILNKPIIKRKD